MWLDLKIPREMYRQGIDLCKKNVLDYLDEAETIAQKGHLQHAYVLVQLGIEETGKIVWLREEQQKNTADPVCVPDVIFGKDGGKSHRKKHEKTLTVLKPELLRVCRGPFDPAIFDPRIFDVGREASPETRLVNAYVGFDDRSKRWFLGCEIDWSKLDRLINHVRQVVSTL
jgi:AbiV family abortive infection protein